MVLGLGMRFLTVCDSEAVWKYFFEWR